MRLALDTNILIALQKQEAWATQFYRWALSADDVLVIPSVVRYEARRGLLRLEHFTLSQSSG